MAGRGEPRPYKRPLGAQAEASVVVSLRRIGCVVR